MSSRVSNVLLVYIIAPFTEKREERENTELEPQQHTQSEGDPEVLVLYHSAGWIVGIVVSRTSLI